MARNTELENSYRLPNADRPLTREEVDRLLSDFEYFMANFQQIIDKEGHIAPFKLNRPQKKLAKLLIPMIAKETRLNQRHNVVVLKCRQMGASVEIVALVNYICAFLEGINNLNVLHVFPVGDSGGKFYANKVVPIITGVHPFVAPDIEKTFTSSTSRVVTYHSTKGARRGNTYEIVSANASSIRGGTINIALLDEVADYRNPYDLEAALSPAIPDYGFSLVVFLSTFSDKKSDYFLEKIKLAREDPEGWTLIFIPWYYMYPERRVGTPLDDVVLTDYDKEVIIPALEKDCIPQEEWGDCIAWYHRKSREVAMMQQEYPTTVDEVIAMSANDKYFSPTEIEKAYKNIIDGTRVRLMADPVTNKTEAIRTDVSPVCMFRQPVYGHKYVLTVDPIASSGEDSDFFAASMWDLSNNEQVATVHGRGLLQEDWTIMSVELCRIYNRAIICPESNICEAFRIKAWDMGYYNWYYPNAAARKSRNPGIRTTVATKETMLEKLKALINFNNIIIHDRTCADEIAIFERQVRKKSNGDQRVIFTAPKNTHDDFVSTLWIYAGMLSPDQIVSHKREGYTIIG